MASKIFALSAALAVALVACSDDDSPGTTATDTGVADSGGGDKDTGVADSGGGGDTGGDGGAEPTCTAYCDAVTTNCTGTKNSQYIDKARCVSMCAKMTVGTLADKDTDTLGCRLSHAIAAKDGPDLNCPQAGATGGAACGAKRCDAYCKLAMAQCPTGAPFTSEADCKAKCPESSFNATAAGGEIDQARTTLNCMQYHMQAAYQSSAAATTHCPHLTITSGPCGPA